MTLEGSERLPVRNVPTLDQIAASPEVVRDLPRHTLADLSFKAISVQQAIAVALTSAEPAVAAPTGADALINAKEAARLLGMSVDSLYHRVKDSPYRDLTVRNGTRSLRFSVRKIEDFVRRRSR